MTRQCPFLTRKLFSENLCRLPENNYLATICAASPKIIVQRENEDMRQDNVLLQAKVNNKERQLNQLKTDHKKLSAEVERNMKESMQVVIKIKQGSVSSTNIMAAIQAKHVEWTLF